MEQAIALAGILEKAGASWPSRSKESTRSTSCGRTGSRSGRLEDEGDRVERECLAALFEGGIDPMLVIRWKDIVERLETGIDSCDHAADLLKGRVVKHA